MRLIAALLLALALAPAVASAKDETCIDGTNCLCDCLQDDASGAGNNVGGYANIQCVAKGIPIDTSVVFCEDAEQSSLDQDGACTGSNLGDGTCGWFQKYGGAVSGCYDSSLVNGHWQESIEGVGAFSCVNVVKETSCEVAGQTDCVFQGAQAVGHRLRPGETQGIVGTKSISAGSNFGVTMAQRVSTNFFNTDSPKKTDEWGAHNNCVLGCSSGTIVSQTDGNPYHGSFFSTSQITGATAVVGQINSDATGFRWAPIVGSGASYDWDDDFGTTTWRCRQFHVTGVGQAGMRIRDWIDGTLWVDVTGIDGTKMADAASGFDSITWNNYTNAGYGGASIAYRYEDNVVVTTAAEPVPCSTIGFTVGTSFSGPAAATLAASTGAAAGTITNAYTGPGAATLAAAVGAAAGTFVPSAGGVAAATLAPSVGAAVGTITNVYAAVGAATLAPATGSAVGTSSSAPTTQGTAAAVLASPTGSATGTATAADVCF